MEAPADITLESRALEALSSVLVRQPVVWDAYRPAIAALSETLFPSVSAEIANADRAWYWSVRGSDIFQDEVLKTITSMIHPGLKDELALLMETLQSRLLMVPFGGRLALSGTWPYIRSFVEMDPQTREALLLSFFSSPYGLLRKAVKSFRGVIITTFLTAPGKDGLPNPITRALGYPGPLSKDERPAVLPEKLESERTLMAAVFDLSKAEAETAEQLQAAMKNHGFRIVNANQEEAAEAPDVVIACDAVIVGSGAGGGVVAGVLSQAGMQVVVLEKGSYVPVEQLSLQEGRSLADMYDRGFLLSSEDVAVNCLAGSTVGGGTRINWCASFRTPDHVRREWASLGLPKFESEEYEHAMDMVCKRINVNASLTRHSKHNTMLETGLKALGVHYGEIPRNVVGQHHCGWCCWGCPSGEKQDTTATFLPDAASHGAKILSGVFAERVVQQELEEAEGPRKRRAVGVLARDYEYVDGGRGGTKWRILVRAPLVVASAGSIQSPALLLRSGISVNDNVGRNLRLHPGTIIWGIFDQEDTETEKGSIRMWEDAPMTIYSRELADWEGSGYGALVTCPSVHLGIVSQLIWNGGSSYKRALLDLRNLSPVLVIDRDTSSGRVRIGSDGLPKIYYWPNAVDRDNLLKLGIRAIMAAGATAVMTLTPAGRFEVERHLNGELANPKAFERYLDHVKAEGIERNRAAVFSAHQMGTCRMGKDEFDSVCDGEGQCWHVAGLYIADASVFPTPSGVNPMVSVESVSYMTAAALARKFRAGLLFSQAGMAPTSSQS